MLRLVLLVLLSLVVKPIWAEVPSGCAECMSECPHDTREMRRCDRGCPSVCTKAQAEEYRLSQNQQQESQGCYECMSECPHDTRDMRSCDRGCPESCDLEKLRSAFVKANGLAKMCGQRRQDTRSVPTKK